MQAPDTHRPRGSMPTGRWAGTMGAVAWSNGFCALHGNDLNPGTDGWLGNCNEEQLCAAQATSHLMDEELRSY